MTPVRWQKISQLFHAALEREGDDRAAFLADACGGDEALRCELESLLAQPASTQASFLNAPALSHAAQIVSDVARIGAGRTSPGKGKELFYLAPDDRLMTVPIRFSSQTATLSNLEHRLGCSSPAWAARPAPDTDSNKWFVRMVSRS